MSNILCFLIVAVCVCFASFLLGGLLLWIKYHIDKHVPKRYHFDKTDDIDLLSKVDKDSLFTEKSRIDGFDAVDKFNWHDNG